MTTLDLSMYGSQASGWLSTPSPDLWFGDNKSSQIAESGLDDLKGWKGGLLDDCDALLEDTPIPLDFEVPDFVSEWMEDWINLDQDDLSVLDDALALEENEPSEGNDQTSVGNHEEKSLIDDTINQLMQLQALAEPECAFSPPVSPPEIVDEVPECGAVLTLSDNLPADLHLHSETVLSPFFETSPSPSSCSVISEPVFDYPVVSCPSPGSESSVELEPVFDYPVVSCPSPGSEPSVELQVQVGGNTILLSFDQSDDSSHSGVLPPSPPNTIGKKRKADLTAVASTPAKKSRRKSNPLKQSNKGLQVKKERKRDQNKTAATRYRLKKRSEADILAKEESLLLDRNSQLKSSVDKLANEIGYLKGLMREILEAKRSKQ